MNKILKAQAKWIQGTKVESETRGFKLTIDKPLEENGTNLGPKPAELSLQALGGMHSLRLSICCSKTKG